MPFRRIRATSLMFDAEVYDIGEVDKEVARLTEVVGRARDAIGAHTDREHVLEQDIKELLAERDHLQQQLNTSIPSTEFNRERQRACRAEKERDRLRRTLDEIRALIIDDCKHCEMHADVPCWEVPDVDEDCRYIDFIRIIKQEASE